MRWFSQLMAEDCSCKQRELIYKLLWSCSVLHPLATFLVRHWHIYTLLITVILEAVLAFPKETVGGKYSEALFRLLSQII